MTKSFYANKNDRGKKDVLIPLFIIMFGIGTIVLIAVLNDHGFITIGRDHRLIAIETEDQKKGGSAVRKLFDQTKLTDVAMEAELWVVRQAAVYKLTDQALLARIALNDEDWRVRRAAVENLTDQTILSQVIGKTEDEFVRAYWMLTIALENAPEGHRKRLRNRIIPAVRLLTNRELTDEVGEIESISTRWSERGRRYKRTGVDGTVLIGGESFKCSIRLTNVSKSIAHSWETVFPYKISSLSFQDSNIDFVDILLHVFRLLSQDLLARIAAGEFNEVYDPDSLTKRRISRTRSELYIDVRVRLAAVENLTDQELLSRIANDANNWRVRRAAKRRL